MLTILFYISLLTIALFIYLRLKDAESVISSEEKEYWQIQQELQVLHQRKQMMNRMLDNLEQQKLNQVYVVEMELFVIQTQKSKNEAMLSENITPLIDDKIA